MHLFGEAVCFFYLALQQEFLKEYHIENYILVIDIEGTGFLNFPFKALQSLIEVTSVLFAGRVHKLIIANPTFMFYGAWKIVSSFLHPEVLEKFTIIPSGKNDEYVKFI